VIKAGNVSDCPTYFADWFPTLCDAAKLDPPANSDGESFWQLLTNKEPNWKRTSPMIWIFPEYGGQVAIQDTNWKLVRTGLGTKKPNAWELYNLEKDPSESTNLSADQPVIVHRLTSLLREANSANEIFPVVIPEDR
jgi:arylsulfatase A-like enzyme